MSGADHTPSLDEQRALAMTMFPMEWGRALGTPGERGRRMRANLRKRAGVAVVMQALRAEGRSCASCAAYNSGAFGSGRRSFCEDDTDFHGYALTGPTDLCNDWRAALAKASPDPKEESR